jgi:hypothetical protein
MSDPNNSPQIGVDSNIGDRGVPALFKDINSKYQASTVNSSGELQISSPEEVLLRRILKVLESNNIVDTKQRQRVVVEAIGTNNAPASTEINATVPVTATLASVTSIAGAGQGPTTGPPLLATTLYQPIWEGPVDQRWRVAEDSHISYQLSMRSHLTW